MQRPPSGGGGGFGPGQSGNQRPVTSDGGVGGDRPAHPWSRSRSRAFDRLSTKVSDLAGRPSAFVVALVGLLIWGFTGPVVGFSETWQLLVNTATTIVTFLMVFLIQHSENKGSRAVQMKLDELIAVTEAASNRMIDIEDLSDDELRILHRRFEHLAMTTTPLDEASNAGDDLPGDAV